TPVDRHDCARCNGTWSTPGRNRGGCRIDGVGHPACEHERRIAVLCCLAIRNLPRTGQALTRVDRVAIKIGTVILPEMNARGLSASSGGFGVEFPANRNDMHIHRVVDEDDLPERKTEGLDTTQIVRVVLDG